MATLRFISRLLISGLLLAVFCASHRYIRIFFVGVGRRLRRVEWRLDLAFNIEFEHIIGPKTHC
jgi:hypothetical protein